MADFKDYMRIESSTRQEAGMRNTRLQGSTPSLLRHSLSIDRCVQNRTDREGGRPLFWAGLKAAPFSLAWAVQRFIEGTVTISPSPNNRVVCLYCGLESAEATNHATMDQCIAALEREANRLRKCLAHARPAVTAACEATPDRKSVGAATLRLTLVA
jgi:hypothetical protein